MTSTNEYRIAEIQILRGIAVIATIFAHSFPYFPAAYSNPGWLGVMLFFVISGFVVSRSMDAGGWQGGAFLIKRAFRLFPVLIIYVAAASASLYFFSGINGWPFGLVKVSDILVQSVIGLFGAQSITLLLGINPPVDMGHLWSLSVEDIFYTTMALSVFVIAFCSLDTKRTLGISSLVLAIIVTALRIFWGITGDTGTLFYIKVNGYIGLEVIYYFTVYLFHWKADFMFLGVSLYCLSTDRLPVQGKSLVALALLSVPFAVELFGGTSERYSLLLTIPCSLVCFVALTWLVGIGNVRIRMPEALRILLIWYGDRSYTIYLMHLLVICFVWLVTIQIDSALAYTAPLFDFFIFFIVTLGSAAIAWPLYAFVEKPFIALGYKVVNRKKSVQFAPPALLSGLAGLKPELICAKSSAKADGPYNR
jgi:peptidoglycan/LPS O-acetylase OafA/YrhL